MKPLFERSTTLFEKIFLTLVILSLIAFLVGCNVDLDILVYAGFGAYVILGLFAFMQPKKMMEVLKKENEDFLVRNQKRIPLIKTGFKFGGFTLAILGIALGYIFTVYY
ncbi:hypothetical protein [Dehalobacter restrictus]|uniref:Uncharacterized protein n=1 Tax=Dehalobacter restrictus TaxID=55583 RepID=A0A857DHI5_9FIRM|nr:hypothetical protein [Dehalobacter restrictus]QHA00098.1 hypothetical protein GQ588_05270 [Dehalobacter restrictus]